MLNLVKKKILLLENMSIYNSKATQIYLFVLPIFYSIGAVGWQKKKKKIR